MNFKTLALTSAVALSTAGLICGCERKVIVVHPGSPDAAPAQAAGPAGAPAPTVADAPPPFYEEGATYNGTVIEEPAGVDDYVAINGGWYFWQPSLNIWVHTRHPENWQPPREAHVYHNWNEHPAYRRGR